MTNKEFIERLKGNDWIYETDENGNVVITKTAGEIFKNHFKKLEQDLEQKELLETELKLEKDKVKYIMEQLKKQDKILEILKRIIKVRPSEIYEFTLVIRGTDEEEDIIKEWLDDK